MIAIMILNHVIAGGIVLFYFGCVAINIHEHIGDAPDTCDGIRRPRNGWIPGVFHAICLSAACIAAYAFLSQGRIFYALLFPAICILISRFLSIPQKAPDEPAGRSPEIAAMILFTIVSAAAGFFRIGSMPAGLNTDEIEIAANLVRMMDGRMRVLDVFGFGVPRVSYAPLLVMQHLLPFSRISIRSWELLCGILCAPVFFRTARLFLAFRPAALATGILVTLPYHMFYNRILFGSHLTLLQLLVIYFVFTAVRLQSTPRLLAACVASSLLLYDYEAGRVMPLLLAAVLATALLNRKLPLRRRVAWAGIAAVSHLTLLLPMILIYRRAPANLFFHRTGLHLKTAPADLLAGFRQSIRMFVDVTAGDLEIFTHPTSPILLLPVAALLIIGCLSALLRAPLRSGLPFWGIGFLAALLPSALTKSLVGNSHRAMMVIPFIPVLIVLGLRELAAMTRIRNRFVWTALGTALMLGQAVWGFGWFFNEVWEMTPSVRELFYRSSEIRSVEMAAGLADECEHVLISPHSNYIEYAGQSLEEPGRIGRLNAKTWLPGNGDSRRTAVVLSDHFDAGIVSFFNDPRFGYRLAEFNHPEGVRLLAGRFDPAAVTAGEREWRRRIVQENGRLRFSGSMMLPESSRVVLQEATPGSTIAWDGVTPVESGVPMELCAGLHAVDITASSDITVSTGSPARPADPLTWNPAFEFDLTGCETGKHWPLTVTPAMLYTIPVHGWRHRIYAETDPGSVMESYIDPYLYKRDHWEEHPEPLRSFLLAPHVREWSSRVGSGREPPEMLKLQWSRGEVEVLLDGRTILERSNAGEALIDTGNAIGEKTLVIRLFVREPRLDIRLVSASDPGGTAPPYAMFAPVVL